MEDAKASLSNACQESEKQKPWLTESGHVLTYHA